MNVTRLAGHTLPNEGRLDTGTWLERNGPGPARCSCGVESQELPNPSQRRKWHREHKQAVATAGR